MKLMLIDDQMPILISLKEALEPGGHECILFDLPELALARFTSEHYDAVITDLKMPKMDGIEVLKQVQKSKPGTPVIILTGYADTENAMQAVNHGAYAFYQKPIKIKQFITVLKELDEQLQLSGHTQQVVNRLVDERAALLAEVNHRVKNNLQVINSLLRMQFRSTSSREAADALLYANNRIHSMALIHDHFYAMEGASAVRLHEYIPVLADELMRYIRPQLSVHFEYDLNTVSLPLDQAIPVGMILNELISNALRHAFPSEHKNRPEIRIELVRNHDNEIKVAVWDNGIGLPEGLDSRSEKCVGLSIVRILVTEQLEGKLTLSSGPCARIEFIFSEIERHIK